MKTAILGGGLAGLTAAVALSKLGKQVLVLEASPRLGGRAQSWTDDVTGQGLDLGPHVVLSTYPAMKAFLENCGTSWERSIAWQEASLIDQFEGERCHSLKLAPLPAPFHFVPSLLRNPRIRFADLYSQRRFLALAVGSTDEEIERLDSISAAALLEELGVSRAAVDHLWRFIALSILNVPLEECSGAAFTRFARFLLGRRDVKIGFSRAPLGDLFSEGARRAIEAAGGEIRLGAKVARITTAGPDAPVELEVEGHASPIRADRVISALDPQSTAALFATDPLLAAAAGRFRRFEPCPYVSLYLWFDRKITDRSFWARAHSDEGLNTDFYDLSNFRTDGTPRGAGLPRGSWVSSNIIYSGRVAHLSDEQIVEETVREIRENLPAAREARVVQSRVHRLPMVIHCPKPGTESLKPLAEQIPGRLYLAGDWVKTGLPSSMEGACASGWTAAELVARTEDAAAQVAPRVRWTPPGLVTAQARFWRGIYGLNSRVQS
jgi:squalene-associated FAD-dependent desaturase